MKEEPKSKLKLFFKDYKFLNKIILEGGTESMCLIFVLFFIGNYLIGQYRNEKISSKWLDDVR